MHQRLLHRVTQSDHGRTSPPRRARAQWWLLLAAPLAYAACGDSDESNDGGDADAASGQAGSASGGRSGGGGRAGASGASPGGTGPSGGTAGRPSNGDAGQGGAAAGEGGAPAGGAPSAGTSGTGDPGSSGAFTGGAGGTDGELAGGAGGSEVGGAGGTGPTGFCATLEPPGTDVTARRCLDFDETGTADDFTPEGGEWVVQEGAYVGTTPEEPNDCGDDGTLMWGSTLDGFSAADVRVRGKLTTVSGADKVVVLRHANPRNRLELNFRANYVDTEGNAGGGDLVLQELVDCQSTNTIDVGEILLPHAATDTLAVEIELRGQRLVVNVNGSQVLDRTFSGDDVLRTTAPGSVGFGVFTFGGSARFDDVVVEALQAP